MAKQAGRQGKGAAAKATVDGDIAVHCAHTEMVPIERVVPNPRNPNTHPSAQIDMLARIIVAQGWRAPITVSRRSGFVVRGHGRLLAAIRAGLSHVPVDFQDYENDAAEWADLIADNRIAELAVINDKLLSDILSEIDATQFDLNLTGFNQGEIDRLMAQYREEAGSLDAVGGAPGDMDTAAKVYRIIIDCATEAEQNDILGKLIELEIPCKSLIL